jgi:hypothetical protein
MRKMSGMSGEAEEHPANRRAIEEIVSQLINPKMRRQ